MLVTRGAWRGLNPLFLFEVEAGSSSGRWQWLPDDARRRESRPAQRPVRRGVARRGAAWRGVARRGVAWLRSQPFEMQILIEM